MILEIKNEIELVKTKTATDFSAAVSYIQSVPNLKPNLKRDKHLIGNLIIPIV